MTEPEEVPQRDCIFCAGTGKVPDRPIVDTSPYGAPTSFVVNPEDYPNMDFRFLCGT